MENDLKFWTDWLLWNILNPVYPIQAKEKKNKKKKTNSNTKNKQKPKGQSSSDLIKEEVVGIPCIHRGTLWMLLLFA